MTTAASTDTRIINGLRIAGWSGAALLLAAPAIAMQFTTDVVWTATDFAVAAGMIALAGGAMELAARSKNLLHVLAAALAVGAGFLTVWAAIAVGINGDGSTDLIYAGVLAVGLLGGVIAGFRSAGLARAMFVTALAQVIAGALSLTMGWIPAAETLQILGFQGVIVLLFAAGALLFGRAGCSRA